MAEDKQVNVLSASFPAPPPFYKYFTSENLGSLQQVRPAAKNKSPEDVNEEVRPDALEPSQLLDLPTELRYLIPPEPPHDGIYRSFGAQYNINAPLPTLRAQGIEQLYPTPPASPNTDNTSLSRFDRAYELTKIAKSILLNFLELVGILSVNPEQWIPKWEDLNTLFRNAHQLINEYRPHQARETLITMMEDQLERKRAEVEGVMKMKDKVDAMLAELGELCVEPLEERVRPSKATANSGLKDRVALRMWKVLDAIET